MINSQLSVTIIELVNRIFLIGHTRLFFFALSEREIKYDCVI
jgi:hypothetical protein